MEAGGEGDRRQVGIATFSVEEAHRNLMLTKALDLSAKRKQPVKLPLSPEDVMAAG